MVKRIFVEKKKGFDVSARKVASDVSVTLGIASFNQMRDRICF